MIDSWERLALKYLKHYIIIKYTIYVRHESEADIGIFCIDEAFIFELYHWYEKCFHILKLMYFIYLRCKWIHRKLQHYKSFFLVCSVM